MRRPSPTLSRTRQRVVQVIEPTVRRLPARSARLRSVTFGALAFGVVGVVRGDAAGRAWGPGSAARPRRVVAIGPAAAETETVAVRDGRMRSAPSAGGAGT